LRGVQTGQFNATHGVANVEKATGLAPLAIDRDGMADGGLDAETIERGPKNFIIVKAVDQRRIQSHFIGNRAVDDTLVQVRCPQSPDLAAKGDVVTIMDFGKMVEGPGLLGKRKNIFTPVVLDLDEA